MKKKVIRLAMCALMLSFMLPSGAQTLILTSDQQLDDLASDPYKKIDNSTGFNKNMMSLDDAVQQCKRRGGKEITVAFDEFFRQYRDDKNTIRTLTPDMDEYVEKISKVSDYTSKHGIGLEVSLLSPLELGQAYKRSTGNTGGWVAFKVGMRDGNTGKFSVQIWHQMQWNNNKGITQVKLKGVKAFAFKQKVVRNNVMAVDPSEIVELKNVKYERIDSVAAPTYALPLEHLRVYGEGIEGLKDYDRVMVVLSYDTQEMDYFNSDALPFLKGLLKKYHDHNVNVQSFYSDEMHIQQDWDYFGHQDEGIFHQRYYTESFARRFGETYNCEPFDMKYLLYLCQQPQSFLPTVYAPLSAQYVLGTSPQDMQRTILLRDRYYKLLNNGVIDLFIEAKHYAEDLFGHEMITSAHSSWAESPTIDKWNADATAKANAYAFNYEYTPDFLWSNTVHQASAVCYDYWKWGEYLNPTGNDYAECGWLDRDYYGAAMGASVVCVNKYPNGYAAAWGMPNASHERRMAINYAYGCNPPQYYRLVTDYVTRDVDVLMLYPMSLVAVDPRFGSWMTQYGYANYLPGDQLKKLGSVTTDGKMQVAAKKYGTICVLYEPLPDEGVIEMLQKFVEAGGKVVWFSTPAMLDKAGNDISAKWQQLLGVKYAFNMNNGYPAPSRRVEFAGELADIDPMDILTDFTVDHVFPVEAQSGVETLATVKGNVVGTVKRYASGGAAYFMGFRARDDQSKSLGYESRTMFEILDHIGAHPATGKFAGVNDNPEHVSRTTPYFATRFPNGLTMIVRHYRTHVENWPGGFSRNNAEDAEILKNNPLPSDSVELKNLKVNGHNVTYSGRLTVGFNVGTDGLLTAFLGQRSNKITVDGRTYTFAKGELRSLTFGPVKGDLRHYQLYADGQEEVTIPVSKQTKSVTATCGGKDVTASVKGGVVTVNVAGNYGRCIDLKLE